MRERAAAIFPFAIAVAFPPAGLLLAAASAVDGDRDMGLRIALAAVVGVCFWALILTS